MTFSEVPKCEVIFEVKVDFMGEDKQRKSLKTSDDAIRVDQTCFEVIEKDDNGKEHSIK